jgi:hypothetical protein
LSAADRPLDVVPVPGSTPEACGTQPWAGSPDAEGTPGPGPAGPNPVMGTTLRLSNAGLGNGPGMRFGNAEDVGGGG